MCKLPCHSSRPFFMIHNHSNLVQRTGYIELQLEAVSKTTSS